MKKIIIILSGLIPLLAYSQDFYETIRAQNGGFEKNMISGKPALKLSGRTRQQDKTNYFIGSIHFSEPVDLTDKQVSLQITTQTPQPVIALAIRFYNQNEKSPCWSFMRWGNVFGNKNQLTPVLFPGQTKDLSWEPKVVNGETANHVTEIRFWLGSTTPDIDLEVVFCDFKISLLPPPRPQIGPQIAPYAEKLAQVQHPLGSIKKNDIERARQNISHHQWARQELEKLKKWADEWMRIPSNQIADLIPMEDAWFKCLCPNCGTQPEFAWIGKDVLQPDNKSIRCTNCKMIFPNDKYPEDKTYMVKTPRGKQKSIKYYYGKDQIAQGENYGPRYHITGAVNYVKQRKLYYLYSVAAVYALTGDKAYAQRVRDVLIRFAEVYPDYVYKFRATAYESPEQNRMAGKLCDWKFHDSSLLSSLLDAYSLTYNSGFYSDADKLAVENGICREFKHMITAFPPTADSCLNAVPTNMTAAAFCAAILGDHSLIDWLLKGSEGLLSFLEKYYHRDGVWYENSAAYGNMSTQPLVALINVLQGYSDSPEYRESDRYDNFDIFKETPLLQKIFTGMAAAVLPTGTLPAFNDSTFNTRQSIRQLELMAALVPTPENRATLQWFDRHYPDSRALTFALFKRDPLFDSTNDSPNPPVQITPSTILPGSGWAIMRRPETFRNSALALTYGKYASHAHNSMLNYIYCDFGREIISDLGYLSWWHNNRLWLNAPLAHNLVIVDRQPQSNRRVAVPELFAARSRIQAMRFNAPSCYPQTTEYARTIFNIPLPGNRQYLVDFFSVQGGENHLWTFHADGEKFSANNLDFTLADSAEIGDKSIGADWLRNLRKTVIQPGTQIFQWQFDDTHTTFMHYPTDRASELFLADAPGLRNAATPYADIKMNLVMIRDTGPNNVFTSVIECHQHTPQILSTSLLKTNGRPAKAVKVTSLHGTDLIILAELGDEPVKLADYPQFTMNARSAVVRLDPAGNVSSLWSEGQVAYGAKSLSGISPIQGKILAIDGHKLITSPITPPDYELAGNYLNAPEHFDGMYLMQGAELQNGRLVITLAPTEVIRLKNGDSFIIQPYQESNY